MTVLHLILNDADCRGNVILPLPIQVACMFAYVCQTGMEVCSSKQLSSRSRGLGRLPTLRLDRRVDALDLVSENDVLVAGKAWWVSQTCVKPPCPDINTLCVCVYIYMYINPYIHPYIQKTNRWMDGWIDQEQIDTKWMIFSYLLT